MIKECSDMDLTASQREAYDAAMSGSNVVLLGGAGTGKTSVIRLIAESLKELGKNVLLCAPTGTAAVMIGGTTIHRAFGFPGRICINEKRMTIKTSAGQLICNTDVLIIDEISICRVDLFDAVIASVKKAEKKTGKKIQLILSGDFYQLPPVLDRNGPEKELLDRYYHKEIGNAYAFQGESWDSCRFRIIELSEVMRQGDSEFAEHLNRIRVGDRSGISYFNSRASHECFTNAVWLFPYNSKVDQINTSYLERLPGSPMEFRTIIKGSVQRADMGSIPDSLHLKPGARVMIMINESNKNQNTDMAKLYHNGTVGTVTGFSKIPDRYVTVRLDTGRTVYIQRHLYTVYKYQAEKNGDIKRIETGSFSQYPLRPAYAQTIHKSQGQTYDLINIDPRCCNPGQLYVALSRAKDIQSIYLRYPVLPDYVITDPLISDFYQKYVYPEQRATESTKQKESSGGRPRRYPTGSTAIRVPTELAESLSDLIRRICPGDGSYDGDLMLRVQKILADI